MIQRIKKLFSTENKIEIDLSKLTPEQLSVLQGITKEELPIGDGQAEFLDDMTEEEYQEYIREEENGWKKFKKQFGL